MILDVLDGPPERGFLAVARPLAAPACERLAAGAREIAGRGNAPFNPDTAVPLFWPAVEGRLLTMLGRTLVVELHLARHHGSLEGATPEERFQSFLGFLRDPGIALDILRDYPALEHQITVALDLWVESSLEFLSRLAADATALREAFSPESDPGRLIGLEGGGDVHRRGRAVLIATFASGLRVVYKPRPLTVDVRFQELLAWIGARSTLPPFRTLKVLDRGGHGWMEFVETVPCQSAGEVRRFHLRLGGLLALLYVLEATDVHFENLLAAGEHPVLVDLESLLHPRPRPAAPAQADLRIAGAALARSVLRVGLLPFQVGAAEGYDGIDLSGLAAVEGELSPNRVLHWENAGTDEMVAVRRRMPMPGSQNRPRLLDREVDALDHLGDLLEGFTEMYGLLKGHREEVESVLRRFADTPVRAILRATRGYHLLWFESFHPDLLRDEADRDRFLNRLRVGTDELPHLESILPFEKRDLHDGDIPVFESRPGSRDLWTWDGQRLADFFDQSALEAAREKLGALGEDDFRFQTWLIRASLSTLVNRREVVDWPSYEPREPDHGVSLDALKDRLLDQARAVGDRLAAMALRKNGYATWIGIELSQRRWSLLPVGEDLYAGLPGIALFLAHLGEVANDVQATELAREALATLRDRLQHTASAITTIGAFQGWGGILYALTHIATLWNERELLAEAEALLNHIPPRIESDQDLDIIGGAAGCIESLLSLAQAGSEKALDIAKLCGDFLVRRAEPVEGGLGWRSRLAADLPQTGFSHGAAGIAHALWRLADATGDERYRDTARGGFLYEHDRYDPMQENWLDIGDKETAGKPRQGGEKATCMAWCYGAPGVGLSRLITLGSGDSFLREDLEAALRATRDRGFGFNHSLCHGDLGNLDLLIQAKRILDRPGLKTEIARRAWSILDNLERNGSLCGTPLGLEVPGLMNGLAGIGYGLLRVAAPERVPSVLSLDPPQSTTSTPPPASGTAPPASDLSG